MPVTYIGTLKIEGKPQVFTEQELKLLPNEVLIAFLVELQQIFIVPLDTSGVHISPQSQKSSSYPDQLQVTGFEYQIQVPDPERVTLDIIDLCFARAVQQALLEFPSEDLELPEEQIG